MRGPVVDAGSDLSNPAFSLYFGQVVLLVQVVSFRQAFWPRWFPGGGGWPGWGILFALQHGHGECIINIVGGNR